MPKVFYYLVSPAAAVLAGAMKSFPSITRAGHARVVRVVFSSFFFGIFQRISMSWLHPLFRRLSLQQIVRRRCIEFLNAAPRSRCSVRFVDIY